MLLANANVGKSRTGSSKTGDCWTDCLVNGLLDPSASDT